MIIYALFVVGSAGLIGSGLVLCLWKREDLRWPDFFLVASLGQGLGLGVTSLVYFFSSLVSTHPVRICAPFEILATAGLGWRIWHAARIHWTGPRPEKIRWCGWLPSWLLGSVFFQVAVVSLAVAAKTYHRGPHGEWDGWAIWSMHARFLWLSGPAWPDLLGQASLDWSHTDYPLLISASVARGWMYLGSDTPIVPGLISVAFAASTVGLLVGMVARLRGWSAALIGGLVLMGTPLFLYYAGCELADIPVGFFMLAATSLIVLAGDGPGNARMLVLAGVAAGFAAWTKNEGLMYCALAGIAYGGFQLSRGRAGNFRVFAAAAFAALLPVLCFKWIVARPNDILDGQGWGTLDKLLSTPRHRLILSAIGREAGSFGEWQFCPLIAMGLYLVGPGWPRLVRSEWVAPATLLLMAAGYYGVYLVTPNDLSWHLGSSLNRLLLQVWPLVVFVWCLAGPPVMEPVDVSGGIPNQRHSRWAACWIVANLALATGLMALTFR